MTHALQVRHLRVHSASRNTVALRLGLEQRLQQTALVTAHLPSSAILIIRRLVAASALPVRTSADPAWSRAIAQQIDVMAQHAAQPLREYVPHDAESVLFWDAVELLTCYTQDVLARRDRWYWRDLFATGPAEPPGTRLLAGWRGYPAAIPRLLVTLPLPQSRQAITCLAPRELPEVVRLVHAQYDVPDTVFAARHAGAAQALVPAEPAAAPWDAWLPPGAADTLAPPAAYLLGLSYALVRQPHHARSPAFAARAARWLEAAPDRADRVETGDRQPAASASDTVARADVPDRVTTGEQVVRHRAIEREHAATVPEQDAPLQETPVAHAPEGITTRYGGVFYLVNAVDWLLAALLPGAAEAVNRWELVAALAWHLLGDTCDPDDAIWSLLRDLAQLDAGAPFGAALPEPAHFCVTPEWLAAWTGDEVACTVQRDAGRLRIWAHEAGFLLADVPDRDRALDALVTRFAVAGAALQWENGSVPAPEAAPPAGAVARPLSPGLAWWASCARQLLDFRVQAALPDRRESWPERLSAPAVIQVTHTHVDVWLALDAIDIDIRRAGLDSDPGWAPDYGYIIYFHFD